MAATERYVSVFLRLVEEQKRIGLTPTDGLYGSLRVAVHDAEKNIKELKDYKLFKDMLMLRRHEKDFMLRINEKYLKKFNKDMQVLYQDLANSPHNESVKQEIKSKLTAYESDFTRLVEGYKVKGLSH